jgi:putative oxidoreductase
MRGWGTALLRLAVGAVFVAHGGQKLFGIWGGAGLSGTAVFFDTVGLGPAYPLAVLVGVAEFGGGILLILGALTLWVSLALVIEMLVAIWAVHLSHGFFLNWGLQEGLGHGYQFNLVLIGALLCLMIEGPGVASVDGYRARSAEAEAAGRARLRAGTV